MNKVIAYILFAFAFLLSFKISLSNFMVILLLTATLVNYLLNKKYEGPGVKFLLWTTAPIFILSLLSLLWSANPSNGLHILGKQATLALIPLAFLFLPTQGHEHFRTKALQGLSAGVFIASVILLSVNFYELYTETDLSLRRVFSSHYTSHRYTALFESTEPAYFGMCSVLALAAVLFGEVRLKISLKVVFTLVVLTNIVFLNSRMIFLVVLLTGGLLILRLPTIKARLIALAILTAALLILGYALRDTYVFAKLTQGTFWELSENVGTSNTTDKITSDSRLARWQCAMAEGRKAPIAGTGLGTEMDVLLPCYADNAMDTAYQSRFNTHNQYLSYFITLGILGVLVYVFMFLSNLYRAIRFKDYVAIVLILTLIMMSFIENIMARNAGVIFASMFIALFYKNKND